MDLDVTAAATATGGKQGRSTRPHGGQLQQHVDVQQPPGGVDLPDAEPLHEPDDMIIVEPPCHLNEPLKVPEDAITLVHCLICGAQFSS